MGQRLKNLYRQIVAFLIFTLILVLLVDKVIMPIYVRKGKEFKLADVRRKRVSQATKILKEQGCEVMVGDTVEYPGMEIGVVVDQQPPAGTMVKPGRVIRLIVSGGKKYFTMPNLVGLALKAAQIKIESLKLNLEEIKYVYDEQIPEGVVCEQSIYPGSPVSAGTSITITVSQGKPERKYVVPNVVGLSLSEARKVIKEAGLKVGIIRYVPLKDLLPNTVIDQNPKANRIYNSPIYVDLQVSAEGD